MKTSLLALLATVVVSSSVIACAPAPDENEESSSAAQTSADTTSRGRTFRVRNTFDRVLQQVLVSGSRGGEPRNQLQGFVAPGGTGTLRIPNRAEYHGCDLTLRFVFPNDESFAVDFNGCTSPATFDGPGAEYLPRGLGGSYGNGNGGGSKSGSDSSKGGDSEGSGDESEDDLGDDSSGSGK